MDKSISAVCSIVPALVCRTGSCAVYILPEYVLR
eukprot:SAG31_NODE_33779_length_340_cov_0.655602_1_plen_33_part_01